MKLVFCGTPEFAVPTLEALILAGHEVQLVLTQPDRPSGRKLELHASPVKQIALKYGLSIQQPEKIKTNQELRSTLESLQPDAVIVVAYGRIIPGWMLELPRFGNINLHGSLLPKYRGAAPIQWAVANGEAKTGVTTMALDAGLDTGAILLESRVPIGAETMAFELFPQLSHDGAKLMIRTLEGLATGTLRGRPQDHTMATLAPILSRDDGWLDLESRTSQQSYDRWRGFYPWPGAYSVFRGKRFIVHRMSVYLESDTLASGELKLTPTGDFLVGAAGGTTLRLAEVQIEGKPRLAGDVFARDFQLRPGERLG